MKKTITAILAFSILLLSFNTIISAKSGSYSWYIKRNGQATPYFSKEAPLTERYRGYYIDKTAAEAGEKVIYLTFDAGYENGNITKILDVLKEEAVPAAFFILDNLIIKNADLLIRMTEEGHLVCNHTKKHEDLTKLSEEEIRDNLTDLEKLYEERTGNTMSKYFRFPEGRYSESAIKAVSDMGYKTIFWSFAYADWDNGRQPSAEASIKKILDNTHNGAVILLHPTSSTNAEILPRLIKAWREMGYRFGTLDELTK